MKDQYYELIRSKEIQDTLSWVDELSYTKKFEILSEVLKKYSVEQLNLALRHYEIKYIRIHRVIPYLIKNILLNYCKRNEIKKEDK